MAWEYQITRLATSTVTSTACSISATSSGSTSNVTSHTLSSVTNLASSGATEVKVGTTVFLGTGGGSYTAAGPVTNFETWQGLTWTSSRTFSQTSSALATVGTTRTVLTGTGGTKRGTDSADRRTSSPPR